MNHTCTAVSKNVVYEFMSKLPMQKRVDDSVRRACSGGCGELGVWFGRYVSRWMIASSFSMSCQVSGAWCSWATFSANMAYRLKGPRRTA